MDKEKKQIKAIEASINSSIKALVSCVPVISLILAARDGYQSSRSEDAINELSEKVLNMKQEKIDKEYIESEEFFDLFSKAMRIRLQSRSKEKARFIVGLLVESMRKDRNKVFSGSLKDLFLSILDQLSNEEMIFLHDFSQGSYHQKPKGDIYQMSEGQGLAMDLLIAKGILTQDSTWDQYVIATTFGKKFIDYIKFLAQEN